MAWWDDNIRSGAGGTASTDPFGGVTGGADGATDYNDWGLLGTLLNPFDPDSIAQQTGAAAAGGARGGYNILGSLLDPVNPLAEGSIARQTGAAAAGVARQAVENARLAGESLQEAAKRLTSAGGEAAQNALAVLAASGDYFAKIALDLGVSYVTATVIVVAGAVGVGLILLKGK